ncbi:MAG TPA: pyridoxal phosphate-dependent aminotransferase [Thermoanaerobaculia bacterium]|jgi:N-succinyldiaminopimelate aminotransferase|nr:pyridoxal phosphate-dependent aminotransferase [Thermoanaerobaculia bacterium]
MPSFPLVAPTVAAIPGSVYSLLAHRLEGYKGEIYPLSVGDTWMEPPAGCRMEDFRVADHPGMHRYAPVQGLPELVARLVERVRTRSDAPTGPENILMTTGATGGLSTVAGAIVAPGDEVLILAPYWPLISGTVRSFHGTPVPVPFLAAPDPSYALPDSPESAVEHVVRFRTERTIALYLSTPNNPSGRAIPRAWIEALVEWARREDLWLIADEVYEDYLFEGEHAYTRPLAPERTFAAHSFSKAFGMAGNRCGYIVGPTATMADLRKVSTHGFYSTPTASQLAGLAALSPAGDAWIANARRLYTETGTKAAARLGVPAPQGSTFLFLNVAEHLGEDGLEGFLGDCADQGLLASPGPSFGPYPNHVRVCFTAAPPDVVERGIEILARRLGR